MNQMNKAIFIDKDGTLVRNVPYNVDKSKMEYMPGVLSGLRFFEKLGFQIFIVTNQAGVAYGYFDEKDLESLQKQISSDFLYNGTRLAGFYYCPHHPSGKIAQYASFCTCRKPLPGLLEDAARQHNIDLSASWMIGDILNDVEAGNRAGCKTIMIDVDNETEWMFNSYRVPIAIVDSFTSAMQIMLEEEGIKLPHQKYETRTL